MPSTFNPLPCVGDKRIVTVRPVFRDPRQNMVNRRKLRERDERKLLKSLIFRDGLEAITVSSTYQFVNWLGPVRLKAESVLIC